MGSAARRTKPLWRRRLRCLAVTGEAIDKAAPALPDESPEMGAHLAERKNLEGPQARGFELGHALGVFREYFWALRKLHFVGPCVTVFGSARSASGDAEYASGRAIGRLLAEAGFTVMTGG